MGFYKRSKSGDKVLFGVVLLCVLFSTWGIVHAEIIDKVIIVVNKEVVTQREFDRMFFVIEENYKTKFSGQELTIQLEKAEKDIREQLVNFKLAISLAKQEQIELDEDEFESRVEKIKKYYKTEEDFLQALNARGTNLSEFKKEIREQMLSQKLIEKEVLARIVVTPLEVRDLYYKNKEKFVSTGKVKLRSIMVRKTEAAKADEDRKRMEKIVSDIEKGKDFAKLAAERSEGPYAVGSGDLGYVSPGQMLEEIDNVIFNLKKGEISDIVETNMGYHLFLAEDVQESRSLEFEEVSDFLKEQLYMKQFEESVTKWLEEKRKNAYISYK